MPKLCIVDDKVNAKKKGAPVELDSTTTGPKAIAAIVGKIKKQVGVTDDIYKYFGSVATEYHKTEAVCVEEDSGMMQSIPSLRSKYRAYDIVVAIQLLAQCMSEVTKVGEMAVVFLTNTYGNSPCYLVLKMKEITLVFEQEFNVLPTDKRLESVRMTKIP